MENSESKKTQHNKKTSVLIVDDDPHSTEILQESLEISNYTIIRREKPGDLSINMIRDLDPNLILLNLKDPKDQGSFYLEVARKITELHPKPMIVLMDKDQPEFTEKAINIGIRAFLIKPVNAEELDLAIRMAKLRFEDMMELHRLKKQLSAEKELKGLYDNIPLPYQSLDEDGYLFNVNPIWLKTLGYDRTEVIGKRFTDFLHEDWKPVFESNFSDFKLKGHAHDVQFKVKHKEGHYLHVLFEGTVAYNPDGSFRQTHCVFRNISEQEAAEEKMMFLSGLMDFSPASIIVHDPEENILYFNRQACILHGFSPDEMKNIKISQLVDPDVDKKVAERQSELKNEDEIHFETVLLRKNGTKIPSTVSIKNIPWEGKSAVLTIAIDMSEQKKVKENLKNSNDRLSLATRAAGVGIWDLDLVNNSIAWNEEMFDIYGVTENELDLIPSFWRDFVHPEDVEREDTIIKQALRDGKECSSEFRIVRPDGTTRIIQSIASILRDNSGKAVRFLGTNQDITDRKQAEEELLKREKLLSNIFDILPVGLWYVDREGKIVKENPAGARMWAGGSHVGAKMCEAFKFYRHSTGEEIEPHNHILTHTLNDGVTVKNELLAIDTFEGDKRSILKSTTPIHDDEGELMGAVVVHSDVTELKKTEKALEKNQQRLTLAIEASDIGFWELDIDTGNIFLSDSIIKYLGYETDFDPSLISALSDIVHPDDRERIFRPLNDGQNTLKPLDMDIRIKNGADEWLWVNIKGKTTNIDEDSRAHGYIGTVIDIDKRAKAEQNLLHAKLVADETSRLKSEMMKNISHELRTPLTAVIGFSDILINEKSKNLEPVQKEYIEHINMSGKNLLTVVDRIIDFADIEKNNVEDLDIMPVRLNELIESVVSLFTVKAAKKNISISTNITSNDLIEIDGRKIKDALYNLIENAVKFTNSEGNIGIEAGLNNGDILISIRDTGIGIPEDKFERIFEPFVQLDGSMTRKYGGTGLGLNLVQKFVEMHGGNVAVESNIGIGSVFKVELPLKTDTRENL